MLWDYWYAPVATQEGVREGSKTSPKGLYDTINQIMLQITSILSSLHCTMVG